MANIRTMIIPEFEYYRPQTLKEAYKLISSLGAEARLLAGGTDIIPELKEKVKKASALISLSGISELKRIEIVGAEEAAESKEEKDEGEIARQEWQKWKKSRLRIGALVTLSELIHSRVIPKAFSPIQEAALTLASPPIRSIATIGGNIVSAVPSADMPPILIAMNARARLGRQRGSRTIPLEEFFKGPRESVLLPGEILREIEIPHPKPGTGACYIKEGRRGVLSLAVAGVAVSLQIQKGKCKTARIVLGAVAPTPLLVKEAGDILRGKKLRQEVIEEAALAASRYCCPLSDVRATEEYRRELVRVLTARAIRKAIDRAIDLAKE